MIAEAKINLPGIEDTVINKAVPSGGDSALHFRRVEACDFPKRGKLGCEIFGSGGLRSRIPLLYSLIKTRMCYFACFAIGGSGAVHQLYLSELLFKKH